MVFELICDFSAAIATMPPGNSRHRILKLLDEAIRRDIHFPLNVPFVEGGSKGRRVAIIDSGCDLTIPRLKRTVGRVRNLVPVPADRPTHRHGTAVAMLISEVAPEATLDI